MNLVINEAITQQQKLILTTQMQTSLRVLQMGIPELLSDVYVKINENPLLDMDDNRKDLHRDYEYYKAAENSTYNKDKYYNPLNFFKEKKTLKDFLREQLIDIKASDRILFICNYIIENIDQRGYLNCSIEDISKDLKISIPEVKEALSIVQSFEPYGVGAINLEDCLAIQLKKRGIKEDPIFTIVYKYLHLVAQNKIKELSSLLKIPIYQVQAIINIIRELEPKPSRGYYTGQEDQYIIPEAFIKNIHEELYILMNDTALPNLSITREYEHMLEQTKNQDTLNYIKVHYSNAEELIRGIEKRRKTIYQILESLIEKQKEYFLYGSAYIKPLQISTIAAELNLNQSTISRAIKDKYIATPSGFVRLRDLFTNSININSEAEMSSNIVRMKIKDIIQQEDKKKPLSDEAIASILRKEGIKIARRTIAKYRIEMDIRSSAKRKIYS